MADPNPRWRRLPWTVLSLVSAGALLAVVIGGLAIGSCHGQGGFCSGEFDQANRDAFYSALAASLGVGPLAVAPFSRRVALLVGTAIGGLAITAMLVRSLWP